MAFRNSGWKKELRSLSMLALPVVLSELGWMAQGIVDTVMVGGLGPAAIGAVALGEGCFYTPVLFGFGLLLGLDTLVAQAFGREDHDECHHWLAQAIYMIFMMTPLLMLMVWAMAALITSVGMTPEVTASAAGYMHWMSWSTLPLLVYAGVRRYLQAVGQAHVITITYVGANLLNWFGDWVLIHGRFGLPAMGVNGAALSTVVSRIFMAAAMLGFAWRYERKRGHPLFANWAAPQIKRMRVMLRLGLPAAGQILLEVGAWNVARVAAGWLTPVALATHQIVLNYASLTYMVPLGVGSAAAVSVGHAVGAKDGPRARRAGWLSLSLGVGFMLFAAVVFAVFPGPLIALYTRDPQVMAVGSSLLLLAAIFQVFDGVQTVATGALRGVGETRMPMIVNLIGYWCFGLPLGFVLCFVLHWGIYGIWIGLTTALIGIAIALIYRWNIEAKVIEVRFGKNSRSPGV